MCLIEYICDYMYAQIHIYICTKLIFQKDHEFEGEQGGVCGRVWREEREVESVLIKTVSKESKQKSMKTFT